MKQILYKNSILFSAVLILNSIAYSGTRVSTSISQTESNHNIAAQISSTYANKNFNSANSSQKTKDLINMGDNLFKNIQSSIYSVMNTKLRSIPFYQSHSVDINGSLVLDYNQGYARMFGMEYVIKSSFGKVVDLWFTTIDFKCSFEFKTHSSFGLAGQLDLVQGRFYNLALTSPTINYNQNCNSSSFFLNPLLVWTSTMISAGVNLFQLFNPSVLISNSISLGVASVDFGGVSTLIPDNQLVILGRDLGKEIKNEISDKLNSTGARLQIFKPIITQVETINHTTNTVRRFGQGYSETIYSYDKVETIPRLEVSTYSQQVLKSKFTLSTKNKFHVVQTNYTYPGTIEP